MRQGKDANSKPTDPAQAATTTDDSNHADRNKTKVREKQIITLAGNAGSGKSSTANRVASVLGYDRFSAGGFMRQLAEARGVSLEKLHELAEADSSIDHEIDAATRQAGKRKGLVVDGRLAFHFIPHSFKVFLSLDPKVASERVFTDLQNNPRRAATESASSPQEVHESIARRKESNRRRYKDLYDIDYLDQSQFDLVIDTERRGLEAIAQQIVTEYKEWLEA